MDRDSPNKNSDNNLQFSLIIPAFNEAERLSAFLPQLVREMKMADMMGELLLVDDGSFPQEHQAYLDMIRYLSSNSLIKLIKHEKNQGKGAAIKSGFEAAQGHWVGFADADGATSPQEIIRLLKFALSSQEYSGVFGSRIRMLGYSIERKLLRHLTGRIFVTLASNLLQIHMYDPQCGCKFFLKKDIMETLGTCRERGFLLDIELIAKCLKNGLKFIEVPISWEDKAGSKVSVLSDGLKMFWGLLRIKRSLQK